MNQVWITHNLKSKHWREKHYAHNNKVQSTGIHANPTLAADDFAGINKVLWVVPSAGPPEMATVGEKKTKNRTKWNKTPHNQHKTPQKYKVYSSNDTVILPAGCLVTHRASDICRMVLKVVFFIINQSRKGDEMWGEEQALCKLQSLLYRSQAYSEQ